MKYIISGTRCNHRDFTILKEHLDTLTSNDFVRVGDCPTGVDAMVFRYCVTNGIKHQQYFANWKEFGYGAGPLRNKEMIDLGADRVWTFGAVNGKNKGSGSVLKLARAANMKIESFYLPAKTSCKCNY